MKTKLYLLALVAAIMASGCDNDNYKYYSRGKSTLHFNFPEQQRDSIVLSFVTYTDGQGIEVMLPLELAGYASASDRHYRLRVVADSTTALEGTHYDALSGDFTFRANRYHDSARIVFHNTDDLLTRVSRRLYIEIVPTDDFDAGIWYRQKADIRFANIVRKPLIWDDGPNNSHSLFFYFGDYSRVKHVVILQQTGATELPDRWPEDDNEASQKLIATLRQYSLAVNKYFAENVVFDENGDKIEPWF
jgi:hypothetical protein